MVKRAKPAAYSEPNSFWRGDGVSGSPRIVIDLSEQKASFYKGGMLVGESPVCTGSDRFPTPKGRFSVIEKDEDHYSSVYGDYIDSAGNILATQIDNRKDPKPPGAKFDGAKMFWFMRVVGGVGMHEGYLPGYADSHGCIRLPSNMARIFYQNARLGTPVTSVE
ncbi:MAG: L,D-transpeptidase family protein [Prosthecobacter sp.]